LVENLDLLEVPSTCEEIDVVVQSLATDKAPGPDGFNNNFLKKVSQSLLRIFMPFVIIFKKEKHA
jgi:hypothetical protein